LYNSIFQPQNQIKPQFKNKQVFLKKLLSTFTVSDILTAKKKKKPAQVLERIVHHRVKQIHAAMTRAMMVLFLSFFLLI
jgi:hypothetical protein